MLRWTTAGAVPTPSTLQVRVQRSYPGRIRAGAPVPTRSMSADEVAQNIRHFTTGMQTPRTSPCDTLVLSGVGVATRPDTPDTIALARSLGIERIVLHVGGEDLDTMAPATFSTLIDTVVIPVQPEHGALTAAARAIGDARKAEIHVAANTTLTANALGALDTVARVLAHAAPDTMTFTYPFPINGNEATTAPSPIRVVAALRPALDRLDQAGVEVRIKGLPACHLGRDAGRLGKTSNRFYVDADHQLEQALVFFPDVVSFFKDDACRHCSANDTCDGFFATYLRRPGFPPLAPIEASTTG